jgi:hypothetical protein
LSIGISYVEIITTTKKDLGSISYSTGNVADITGRGVGKERLLGSSGIVFPVSLSSLF